MSNFGFGLSDIFLNRSAQSRSISAENPTGEKGAGAMAEPDADFPSHHLGRGWKASPARGALAPGQTIKIADINGSGIITHMWFAGIEEENGHS